MNTSESRFSAVVVAMVAIACGARTPLELVTREVAPTVEDAGGCTDTAHCVDAAPPPCATTRPEIGAACDTESQKCSYGTTCALTCSCDDHRWSCTDTCANCPPTPTNGARCPGRVGLVCKYEVDACTSFLECHCVATGGDETWACVTDCADAGH
jgi:hypothetical protein